MKLLKKIKRALLFPLIGIVFASSALIPSTPVYAEPSTSETSTIAPGDPSETTETAPSETTETEESEENTENTDENSGDKEKTEGATCYSQVGGLGWLICPVSAFLARAVDTIYDLIEDFLILEPISMEDNSPVYIIWLYARNITNIVFIIFLMLVIYSQLTGFGISNYGIKKTLPRLIIAAILVNISYILCVAAVDLSNIIGRGLHDFLSNVATEALSSGAISADVNVSFYDVFTTIAAGGVIGALAVGLSGGPLGLLLTLIPVILGGIISVIIGLATISLRQAVIILLVAIAPLAFVAYLLPNTEKWFSKWVNLFSQMLFFYPMFSLLFGASKLASWIFMSSANSMLGVILGLAVQVLPLILALSLMKMAGTVLGGISSALGKLGDKANAGIKNATEPYKQTARAKQLAKGMRQPFNPLSGASWRAASHKQQVQAKFLQEKAEGTVAGLTGEHMNALRKNSRIIGYDKNDQPIYTQLPIRRSNKYMDAEAEAREIDLRNQADNLSVENAYGNLGDYQKEKGIKRGRATKNASRMGSHYIDLRTQMDAKARNDEADERFYNETVMRAAERYDHDDGVHKAGDLKNVAAYNRIVNGALGATGYSVNQLTDEGRRLADQARVNVIGDAYSRNEAQRSANISRFMSYMDKQVTAEVLRQYEDMIKFDNTDGIVAAHNVLAKRGDYDQIAKHMTDYMNSGKVKLGEDMANTLAMNFLGMKDAAPALARLGKFMNMETWQFTSGNRQTAEITMEQYITGKVEGDVNKKGEAYTTKIKMASGLEGTKLTGIDRTAYGVNDAIVRQFDSEFGVDYDTAYKGRYEIEKAMLPAEISALPTFASGSEQIRSMAGHLTGMKFDSKTGKWHNVIRDEDTQDGKVDRAIVDYTTDTYLKSLTVRDLINMKSDTWAALETRYAYDYASKNNIDLYDTSDDNKENVDRALEAAHEVLRKKLETRVMKLAQGNMNIDMMKEPIYDALKIGELREKYRKQFRHTNNGVYGNTLEESETEEV